MYEYLALFIALAGTLIAAYSDLKTTEISDWIPIIIGGSGIGIFFIKGVVANDFSLFRLSITTGILFLLIGYILYFLSQWGEGDTLIFGSVGFIIPYAFIFFPQNAFSLWYPFHFIANTFIIGFVYSLIYAMIISISSKELHAKLSSYFKEKYKFLFSMFAAYTLFYISIAWFSHNSYNIPYDILFSTTLHLFLIPVIFYPIVIVSRLVDNYAFKKKIPVSELCVGDVLAENISEKSLSSKYWVGLEEADIKNIRSIKSHVMIKEGVRFAPTFFLAILFTWQCGSALSYIFLL
ncbi:MAG: hypothetical protein KAJ54_00625 [Candidatus Aenigmarchaeota archaeon]|nr:hypothetical protein [Candidatus Aenigmarchaeota archaeon]